MNQPEHPWTMENVFVPKPEDSEYGYCLRDTPVGCSKEKLIEVCRQNATFTIRYVWTPEAPTIVPIESVPYLVEALRSRFVKAGRIAFGIGIGLGVAAFVGWAIGGLNATLGGVVMLLAGPMTLFLIGWGLKQFYAAQRVSPETAAKEARARAFAAWLGSQHVTYTYYIAASIIAVGITQVASGVPASVQAAGLVKTAVRAGEFWRLLTAPMLHGNFNHIWLNLLALLGFGRLIEVFASRSHVAIVFLLSMLCGSLFSLLLLPNATSVGASGGLMGLLGFMAVVAYRRKAVMPPQFLRSIVRNLAILAVLGVALFFIVDNGAHLGGVICGAALGIGLIKRNDLSMPLAVSKNVERAGTAALGILIMIALWTILILLKPHF
jgi:membrane associated rhomboid family serine protease